MEVTIARHVQQKSYVLEYIQAAQSQRRLPKWLVEQLKGALRRSLGAHSRGKLRVSNCSDTSGFAGRVRLEDLPMRNASKSWT